MHQMLHVGALTVIETFADRTPYGAVLGDDGGGRILLRTRHSPRRSRGRRFAVPLLRVRPRSSIRATISRSTFRAMWRSCGPEDQERVALLL